MKSGFQLGLKRISQVAFCCGQKYWRWRFEGRHFSTCVGCFVCHRDVKWLPSPGTKKSASLRYYNRQREANIEDGRTAHGTPFLRRPNFVSPYEGTDRQRESRNTQRDHYRRDNVIKHRRLTERRAAAGLNSRGQPRKNNLLSEKESAYRAFRETLNLKSPRPEYSTARDSFSVNSVPSCSTL